MGKSLEMKRKPLDYDVEKDGAKEIDYNDSKDSYDYLLKNDIIEEDITINKFEEKLDESDAIERGTAESEMPDEPLWDARKLGKTTINEPTLAKQEAAKEDKDMIPVSKTKFEMIKDELEQEDIEMQKKLDEAVAELEGIF